MRSGWEQNCRKGNVRAEREAERVTLRHMWKWYTGTLKEAKSSDNLGLTLVCEDIEGEQSSQTQRSPQIIAETLFIPIYSSPFIKYPFYQTLP